MAPYMIRYEPLREDRQQRPSAPTLHDRCIIVYYPTFHTHGTNEPVAHTERGGRVVSVLAAEEDLTALGSAWEVV